MHPSISKRSGLTLAIVSIALFMSRSTTWS